MACVYAALVLHDDGIPITVCAMRLLWEIYVLSNAITLKLIFSRTYSLQILIHHQEEKIKTLTEAAGISVEPYWPAMFAQLLQNVNVDDMINNIGAAPAAGAGAGAAAGAASGGDGAAEEAPKEEEKEESEEEEEEDMDFDLFD